jgi:sirohydrochlorin ferrochelatase
MAPVTESGSCAAVIVAHGFPSDPEPQDERLKALATSVAALCGGWTVRGATLAMPGALEAALVGLRSPLVYPFFMAEGYFTRRVIPERLGHSAPGARLLPPFGSDPALASLMIRSSFDGAKDAGLDPPSTALLIAAHGSKVSASSKNTALTMAQLLASQTPFRRVNVGLIEEKPYLSAVARGIGPAICIPFFALRAGHVEDDVPNALTQAGFTGPVLSAIGEHAAVPRLITDALLSATQEPQHE